MAKVCIYVDCKQEEKRDWTGLISESRFKERDTTYRCAGYWGEGTRYKDNIGVRTTQSGMYQNARMRIDGKKVVYPKLFTIVDLPVGSHRLEYEVDVEMGTKVKPSAIFPESVYNNDPPHPGKPLNDTLYTHTAIYDIEVKEGNNYITVLVKTHIAYRPFKIVNDNNPNKYYYVYDWLSHYCDKVECTFFPSSPEYYKDALSKGPNACLIIDEPALADVLEGKLTANVQLMTPDEHKVYLEKKEEKVKQDSEERERKRREKHTFKTALKNISNLGFFKFRNESKSGVKIALSIAIPIIYAVALVLGGTFADIFTDSFVGASWGLAIYAIAIAGAAVLALTEIIVMWKTEKFSIALVVIPAVIMFLLTFIGAFA